MITSKIISVVLAIFAFSGDFGYMGETPTIEYVEKVEIELLNEYMQNKEIVEEPQLFEDIEVCSDSSSKTYMNYRLIASSSTQGRFIAEHMTVKDGFLYDEDGYMGVALGSYFGQIGDRFIFTLDTGIELKLIKVERKSDKHTYNGCIQRWDRSVIEFVIDLETNLIPRASNGYVAQGNFNNLPQFNGKIMRIQKEKED